MNSVVRNVKMYAWRNATNSSSKRISRLSSVTGMPDADLRRDPVGDRDQQDQRRQHDVAGDHVGEQTNHQRERLDHRADQFQEQQEAPT